jgi:predicted extracellular nuclease
MQRSSRGLFAFASVGLVSLAGACAHGNGVNSLTGGDSFGGYGGYGGLGGGGPTTSTHTGATNTATNGTGVTTGPGATTTDATGPGVTTGATTTNATTGAGAGSLLFSEYVEGSSYNKALEISNRGSGPASLSGCTIEHYVNGATTASPASTLDPVTLQPGQTYVICNSQFSQPSLCTKLDGKIAFTGNDVAALKCGGAFVDVIGTIGDSNIWGTAPTSTSNATLRRKCTVKSGDTNPNDPFDPATEWNGFPVDTLSDLGQDNCP